MMQTVYLPGDCSQEQFREVARQCLAQELCPDRVLFVEGKTGSLFEMTNSVEAPRITVPRLYQELLSKILCHTAEDRFALLYRLLWRIAHGERQVLERFSDPDVRQAMLYARAVQRDAYRMRAFVRFSEKEIDDRTLFVAWFEPQFRVLSLSAPFFIDRFTNMDWLIATPHGTMAWRDGELSFGPPGPRPREDGDPVLDELWTTYYRVTFNPARLRVKAMVAQMPKRHWPTLPETAQMPDLVRMAKPLAEAMAARPPDTPPKFADSLARRPQPSRPEPGEPLEILRSQAEACTLCPLHGPATQTVFGEGPANAEIMFVGEQPGDQEDLAGRPFVGPAGQVFNRALAEVGIDRSSVYVTNAVKHFKFEPRGKRRLHSKPAAAEVHACRFWLDRELAHIQPKLIVALGATAALGVMGRAVAVTKERGRILEIGSLRVLVTVHPSYLLRLPDPERAKLEYEAFVQDLRLVSSWCQKAA